MRLKKQPIKSKISGFMIAEAVFSVFITVLVVVLLQGLIKSLTTADQSSHRTDDLVFAYVQFNRFLRDGKNKRAYAFPKGSNSRQAAVIKVDKNDREKMYLLKPYKNMIRVTTPEGGHMPLLLNVTQARFATKDGQIKIQVTEKDGRNSEIYFKLDAKPKEKSKDETKKAIKGKS